MSKVKHTAGDSRRLSRLRARAEALLMKSPAAVSAMPGGDVQRLVHELGVHQIELEMQNEELRHVQLELENSRDRFARLYDLAPVGYLTLKTGDGICEANLTAARLLGVDRRELLQEKISRFIAAESQDDFYLHKQQVLKTGSRQSCELQMKRSNGEGFTVLLETVAETVAKGKPPQFLVALRDVTRRRQAENALQVSQAQLAGIIRSAMDAIITVNSQQRIVLCNEAAERMFGRTSGQLMGQPLDVLIPKGARPPHAQHVHNFGATGATNRQMGALGQVSGLRADGTEFPMEASISQIEQDGQKFFTVILRDITERLRSEDALRREKEFSEGLVNIAPVIVLVLDPKGRIVRFNSYLTEITGHRLEDVQGQDWFATFLPAADHERIRKRLAGAVNGLHTQGNINPILTKDGRLRHIEWFDTQLRAADGTVTGVLTIGRDVTERLRAEETLRRNEAALSDFFAESPLGLLWVGPEGCIQRVNRVQLEMLGCAEAEVLGHCIGEFFADPGTAAAALDRLANHETLNNHRVLLRRKNGSKRHVLIDANGLWMEGQLTHSRWFARDITNRIELQTELLQIAERERQRIGRDLHDGLGQQLHGLSYLAALLEKDLQQEASPRAKEVRRLNKHLGQALELTRAIAHGLQPVKPVPEGLMQALREVAARTRRVYGVDCRFECRTPVLVHRQSAATHLYRIAQEAVNNAMKHGKATRILIQLAATPERIMLGIRNNGAGIRRRAETAKGMGLHIMQYRAETIGGSLVVQRLPKRGTEVVCTVARQALLSAESEIQ